MSGESFENTDLEIEQETGSLPEDVGTVLDEDENVMVKLPCNHVFHQHCIEKWVKTQHETGLIPQCAVCNDNILNLHTYRDYFTKTLFPHKIQDILDSTDETGHTTMVPISYDYRLSNLCNFKCRMCGDQLSSSCESENKIHTTPTDAWLQPNTRRKISNFQVEVLEEVIVLPAP